MTFRYFKRIRIAPGLTVNLSKSGMSLSIGRRRGAKLTLSKQGGRVSPGIPGTGLYYSEIIHSTKKLKKDKKSKKLEIEAENKLTLNFFQRLVTPYDEADLIDGCRELFAGNYDIASEHIKRATHLVDGAFLAGFMALKEESYDESEKWLLFVLGKNTELGKIFAYYDFQATIDFEISDKIYAFVEPDTKGVLLGLAAVYIKQRRFEDAVKYLIKLRELSPDDSIVKLLLIELLLETNPEYESTLKNIIRLTGDLQNDSAVETTLLFHKAKALRALNKLEASLTVFTQALRRKKNRPVELMRSIRYERALLYQEMGKKKRAKFDFEKLYLESPDFEDVADQLKENTL